MKNVVIVVVQWCHLQCSLAKSITSGQPVTLPRTKRLLNQCLKRTTVLCKSVATPFNRLIPSDTSADFSSLIAAFFKYEQVAAAFFQPHLVALARF
ncbi:hypothetical protein [Rheinheimera sp. 4Y26]|uniref:hypothetical protein n=1 Tax=Rheinheimera sp. 4Y26 TaxID=2977811 RepID=UPI0021B0E52D|nr:hypothetical protein [Rheinheimera sp. 4Y26]MCT6698952.1 hypothetical protein [Rheinheimera sp. 4Y26]